MESKKDAMRKLGFRVVIFLAIIILLAYSVSKQYKQTVAYSDGLEERTTDDGGNTENWIMGLESEEGEGEGEVDENDVNFEEDGDLFGFTSHREEEGEGTTTISPYVDDYGKQIEEIDDDSDDVNDEDFTSNQAKDKSDEEIVEEDSNEGDGWGKGNLISWLKEYFDDDEDDVALTTTVGTDVANTNEQTEQEVTHREVMDEDEGQAIAVSETEVATSVDENEDSDKDTSYLKRKFASFSFFEQQLQVPTTRETRSLDDNDIGDVENEGADDEKDVDLGKEENEEVNGVEAAAVIESGNNEDNGDALNNDVSKLWDYYDSQESSEDNESEELIEGNKNEKTVEENGNGGFLEDNEGEEPSEKEDDADVDNSNEESSLLISLIKEASKEGDNNTSPASLNQRIFNLMKSLSMLPSESNENEDTNNNATDYGGSEYETQGEQNNTQANDDLPNIGLHSLAVVDEKDNESTTTTTTTATRTTTVSTVLVSTTVASQERIGVESITRQGVEDAFIQSPPIPNVLPSPIDEGEPLADGYETINSVDDNRTRDSEPHEAIGVNDSASPRTSTTTAIQDEESINEGDLSDVTPSNTHESSPRQTEEDSTNETEEETQTSQVALNIKKRDVSTASYGETVEYWDNTDYDESQKSEGKVETMEVGDEEYFADDDTTEEVHNHSDNDNIDALHTDGVNTDEIAKQVNDDQYDDDGDDDDVADTFKAQGRDYDTIVSTTSSSTAEDYDDAVPLTEEDIEALRTLSYQDRNGDKSPTTPMPDDFTVTEYDTDADVYGDDSFLFGYPEERNGKGNEDDDVDDDDEDEDDYIDSTTPCVRPTELGGERHPATALVSFPGAITDWMKRTLELLTGEPSDSVYRVISRLENGELRPFREMNYRSVVETHSNVSNMFDQGIVLLRNPIAVEERHLLFRPFATDWQYNFLWAPSVISWLKTDIPVLVVTYEDMVVNMKGYLSMIADFLNMTPKRENLACAMKESPPVLIQDASRIAGVYSQDRRRIGDAIDSVIDVAAKRCPGILRRLFMYKSWTAA